MISQPKTGIKRDPFYVDPLPKAHYHPTEKKNLSEGQKKTAISPVRTDRRKDYEPERLSYNDELFLKGGNALTSKSGQDRDVSGSSKFDESWPSTDRPLSITDEEHPLNDIIFQTSGSRFSDLKKTLKFPEKDPSIETRESNLLSQNGNMRQEGSSTLQKYIERFRSGQPMSREERQKATSASQRDFWWLSERSDKSFTDSSTPKDDSPGVKRTKRFTPHSPINPYKGHTDKKSQNIPSHTLDDTTKLLQEKADRLLDSASSVASSDPIVSTDGLGSSQSFSTTISSVEEQPYRPSFARKWEKQDKHSYQIPKPKGQQPSGPEDDVLYQWRLKRRIEQARDNAAKSPAVKFGFKDKYQGQKEVDQKLEEFKQRLAGKNLTSEYEYSDNGGCRDTNVPVSHGSVQFTPAPQVKGQTQHSHDPPYSTRKEFPVASPMLPHSTGADKIEPHFHLTCDLLPCSHQGYKMGHESQKEKKCSDENMKTLKGGNVKSTDSEPKEIQSGGKSVSSSTDEDTKSDRYKFLKAERPDIENKDKKESEIRISVDEQEKKSEKVRHDSDDYNYKMDKSYERHKDKHRKEAVIQSDSDLKIKKTETVKDNIPVLKLSGKPTVSKPAVENAIGQVVKDRLFNISTSTVMSSIDSEASSPPRQPKQREKHQKSTDDADASCESDGEYPDDQLLSLLRQQRAQYEEQLRHIDDLLARLEPEDR